MKNPEHEQSASADIDAASTALHVIAIERDALNHLSHLYRSNTQAQDSLRHAVAQITQTIRAGGKLVVTGMGKSGKIGRKVEATMNSLGIHSVFLHPTEALHGDVGIVRPVDTLLLISYSGRTPELLRLLPYIPCGVALIAITSHTDPSTCPLLTDPHRSEKGILLPAPVHVDEEAAFGVAAPTSSTTVALVVGDALALAVARCLHTEPGRGPAEVFKAHHPGGAIGAALASSVSTPMSTASSSLLITPPTSVSLAPLDDPEYNPSPTTSRGGAWGKKDSELTELMVPIDAVPTAPAGGTVLDVLLTSLQHPAAKLWVKLSATEVIPPSRVRWLAKLGQVNAGVRELPSPVSVHAASWLRVAMSTPLREVREIVRTATKDPSVVPLISVIDAEDSCVGLIDGNELLDR